MIEYKKAVVEAVHPKKTELDEVILDIEHDCKKAINYRKIVGSIKVGDVVLVNTTACTLHLGTGGYHFIIANLSSTFRSLEGAGHGIKLKYTPIQARVLFSEEEQSSFHQEFYRELSLQSKLVYIGELHSMLLPLCAQLKYDTDEKINIACIITDHGALPVSFSRNIDILKSMGLLETVISIGNAFGGDYECVNIYTALQLAMNILNLDVAIITMGPGIMGTGTPFGFSGLEMAFYLNFCWHHGGNPLYIPRLGFTDHRSRHYGISHHSLNLFRSIIQVPTPVILPIMPQGKVRYVLKQIQRAGLINKYPIIIRDGRSIEEALAYYKLFPTTMGRNIAQEPDFFHCIGAVSRYGLSLMERPIVNIL